MDVPRRVVRLHRADREMFRAGIEAVESQLGVTPEFPPDVVAAAEAAAADPVLPALDRTDIPFVTVDPPGSMDLDQALHLERAGDGYVVHYAIADVAAFVEPGGSIDREAHRRGETLYGADARVPLHPPVLSEGAASLLPGHVRPSLLWTVRLDSDGGHVEADVQRALVRSRRRYTYEEVQADVDSDSPEELFLLLQEVGELRIKQEVARGGVSLSIPEQEIDVDGDHWGLRFRSLTPAEHWNAQISLLTGMAAGELMASTGVGILRTLPAPHAREIETLHRTAHALGIEWPDGQSYADFIRDLDPDDAGHVAMMLAATRLLRGAGYVAFDGTVPSAPEHAALGATYSHVTAPLRRLVDRYALEVCVALCAGEPVPDWVLAALPELPRTMQESSRRAGQYEAAVVSLVEAGVLQRHVGEEFAGAVVGVDTDDPRKGVVVLREPAIEAPVTGTDPLPLGADVRVRLVEADLQGRRVRFEL